MSGGKCVPWNITCKHRRFCWWYECGHVVPSITHTFHRSFSPTQVNRGQLRSNEVNDLCRLFRVLLPSKVIWSADFDSDIHFALRRLEMRSWNRRVIKGQWRHMTLKWFFAFVTHKNYPWAFNNHRNVFYSSQGTHWQLKFCSSSIRSKVIGDHGFSSFFGTWPDLRGHWLT